KAIDGAEGELAALGGLARAGHVVEQPGDLGGGEIGIDDEAGARRDRLLMAFGAQLGAALRGAAVLPDDGARDRAAGLALPYDRGLALIGDADRRDLLGLELQLGKHRAAGVEGCLPDLLRLVLDPAGLRVMLLELALRLGARLAVAVEQHGPRAGSALVDGEDVSRSAGGHSRSSESPRTVAASGGARPDNSKRARGAEAAGRTSNRADGRQDLVIAHRVDAPLLFRGEGRRRARRESDGRPVLAGTEPDQHRRSESIGMERHLVRDRRCMRR